MTVYLCCTVSQYRLPRGDVAGNRRGTMSLKGDHEVAVWTGRQTFQAQTLHGEDKGMKSCYFQGVARTLWSQEHICMEGRGEDEGEQVCSDQVQPFDKCLTHPTHQPLPLHMPTEGFQ